MPSATLELGREARSAGSARRFVADVLAAWDAGNYCDRAELVVSELVTNAILHAHTDVWVRVTLLPEALRIEVADGSPARPLVRHYSRMATTGRGLSLVASVAREWGISPEGEGKVVWAELGPADPGHASGPVNLDMFDTDDELWGTSSSSAGSSGGAGKGGRAQ